MIENVLGVMAIMVFLMLLLILSITSIAVVDHLLDGLISERIKKRFGGE